MKCLIMSCVIFCAAQDVIGVRKEHRERKRWEEREIREEYKEEKMDERQRGKN